MQKPLSAFAKTKELPYVCNSLKCTVFSKKKKEEKKKAANMFHWLKRISLIS